jgi:hypothetical protein
LTPQSSVGGCARVTGATVEELLVRQPADLPEPYAVRGLVLESHAHFGLGRCEMHFELGLEVTVKAGEGMRQIDGAVASERQGRTATRADTREASNRIAAGPRSMGQVRTSHERPRDPRIVRRHPEQERNRAPAEKEPTQRLVKSCERRPIGQLHPSRCGRMCPKGEVRQRRQGSAAAQHTRRGIDSGNLSGIYSRSARSARPFADVVTDPLKTFPAPPGSASSPCRARWKAPRSARGHPAPQGRGDATE